MKWIPISAAPRDGTLLLLATENGKINIGYYGEVPRKKLFEPYWTEGWRIYHDTEMLGDFHPMFFMYLPPFP